MKKFLRSITISIVLLASISLYLPEAVRADDEKITIRVPEPRINIPGLDFTSQDPSKLIQKDSNGRTFIQVPYLAQYIATVYKYLVGIASILAVIMIIVAGFQWSISGGNTATIDSAKKRIGNAVTGLVLAVGSYALLYAINPALVQFRSLRLIYVEQNNSQIFFKGNLFPDDTTGGSVPTTGGATQITCNGKSGEWIPPNILGISMECGSCDVTSRRSPPPACRIARESIVGSNNMLYALRENGGAGGYNSKRVNDAGCPLTQKTPVGINPGETTAYQKDPRYNKYDELFTRYANCLPITNGEKLLKSIAYAESRFKTSAKSEQAFNGLFQTKSANCFSALNKYGEEFTKNCSNVNDPETSTAVGAAMAVRSINIITEECANNNLALSDQAFQTWVYIGHHSGPGALRSVLRASQCDHKQLCSKNYQFWLNHNNGAYRDSTPPPCA